MAQVNVVIQTDRTCCDTDCPFFKDTDTTRCLLFKEELYTSKDGSETFRCDDCLWVTSKAC